MGALNYLSFIKMKAAIRNIYRKPVSAIFTTLALLLMVVAIYFMIVSGSASMLTQNIQNLQVLIMIYLGYILFMFGIFLFQKRSALVYKNDANFIIGGPFTRKQVMMYIIMQSFKSSILIAIMGTAYFCFIGMDFGITLLFAIVMTLAGLLAFALIVLLVDYFYLLEITQPKFKLVKKGIFAVAIIIIGALLLLNLTQANFNVKEGFIKFIEDPMFHFVPLFGWIKGALVSVIAQDYAMVALYFGLIVALCAILMYLLLTFKGDYYEKVLEDAEWVTEYTKNMRKTGSGDAGVLANKKIREVKNVNFKEGARALFDKNILQLRKTNSWIRKQEVGLMFFYMAIAYFGNLGFTFYQYYILIIVMVTITNDGLMKELKSPYIYILPANPMAKLWYSILPLMYRTAILVTIAIVPSIIVFNASILEMIFGLFNVWSYIIVFIAGSVWALKILKSGTNAVAEQFIRMIVILISMIPAVVVTLIPMFVLGSEVIMQNMLLFSFYIAAASVVMNVLVGYIMIYFSKSLLSGNNIMAD